MSGVRQRDVLSPTLFSLFINDMAAGIKSAGIGVPFTSTILNVLFYADDAVLLAESEKDLQSLDRLYAWLVSQMENQNK